MTATDARPAHAAAGPALSGFRKGAFGAYRGLIVLFALGLLVQVFLAGFGIFGSEGAVTDDEVSKDLDAHRALGHILTQPVALLILIAALLARPGRRIVPGTVVLFVLGIAQMFLAFAGEDTPFFGGLHALNAVLLIGVTAFLVHTANARR